MDISYKRKWDRGELLYLPRYERQPVRDPHRRRSLPWPRLAVTLAHQTRFTWPDTTAGQSITIPATTIGNLIVVAFGAESSANRTATPSVGGVTTWTRTLTVNTNKGSLDVWAGIATSSATALTLTSSTGATTNGAQIAEFAATNGWISATAGTTNSGTSAGSNSISSGAITPGESNDLIVGASCRNGTTVSSFPASPWSNLTSETNLVELAWQQQGAAASITASWGLGASVAWNAAIASYKPVAVSSTDPPFVSVYQPSGHYQPDVRMV